jgi:dual specificity phosphatase 12
MRNVKITHVVSVLNVQADDELFKSYRHLIISVDDMEDEDLISHFATTNTFIQAGIDEGGAVLVHWSVLTFSPSS